MSSTTLNAHGQGFLQSYFRAAADHKARSVTRGRRLSVTGCVGHSIEAAILGIVAVGTCAAAIGVSAATAFFEAPPGALTCALAAGFASSQTLAAADACGAP